MKTLMKSAGATMAKTKRTPPQNHPNGLHKNRLRTKCPRVSHNPLINHAQRSALSVSLYPLRGYNPSAPVQGDGVTPHIPPTTLAGICAACGFDPVALMAIGTADIAAAFQPGAASVLVPILAGHDLDSITADPTLASSLQAGAVLLLAFERLADAQAFDRQTIPTGRAGQ